MSTTATSNTVRSNTDVSNENVLPTHANQEHNNNTAWLDNFTQIYQRLDKDNLHLLNTLYHQKIAFQDPIHKVNGLDAFTTYFKNLYSNIKSCKFIIDHTLQNDNEAAVYWRMHYQHPQLNFGNIITVSGHSHIKEQGGKIIYHRDYLDAGAMIYEHIPVFGRAIRWLKKRVQ